MEGKLGIELEQKRLKELTERLHTVRQTMQKVYENAGILGKIGIQSRIHGDAIQSGASIPEAERIKNRRELNAFAVHAGLKLFTEAELDEIEQIDFEEVCTGSLHRLPDIPNTDNQEPEQKDAGGRKIDYDMGAIVEESLKGLPEM